MSNWLRYSKWVFVGAVALFVLDCFFTARTVGGSLLPDWLARLVIYTIIGLLPVMFWLAWKSTKEDSSGV